jgi:NADPH:quinone reductase-like Zn-dependent oxidoreductase
MRAVVINEFGNKNELVEQELPKPEIKANQVLVEVYATSINPIDWKLRAGYLKQMLDCLKWVVYLVFQQRRYKKHMN